MTLSKADQAAREQARLENLGRQERRKSVSSATLQWRADNDPAPMWAIAGLMPATGLTLIAGRPKITKSWLAYLAALSMANGKTGRNGLLRPSEPRSVLYVDRETITPIIASRFRALAAGEGLAWPSENLHFWEPGEGMYLDEPSFRQSLLDEVRYRGSQYVFIDTLARSMVGDENNSQAVGRVLRIIEDLRKEGCGICLVHHLGKAAQEPVGTLDADLGLRGSSALAGAYESIMTIHRALVRDETGTPGRDDFLITGGKYKENDCRTLAWDFVDVPDQDGVARAVSARLVLGELQDIPVAVDARAVENSTKPFFSRK